ncbi:MAG: hypothetical protein BGO31_12995 [Bacteroidetes bacterium 43-16]|nr:MAG: hypothetical protein BGO31_12995 [Bacteroidetes bacterium 43-16]
MYQQLKEKLWAYIVHNNPDLMFDLQEEYNVTKYLDEKVSAVMPTVLRLLGESKEGHAIQELAMNELTAGLKPSRYHYIQHIISEEFEADYERLRESGLLTYETVNLVSICKDTLDKLGFSEEKISSTEIHEVIKQEISSYLNGAKTK